MKWIDFLCFFIFIPSLVYGSGAYSYRMPKGKMDPQALTVIGVYQKHQIEEGETMLDIARYYDLGYQELMASFPNRPLVALSGKNYHNPYTLGFTIFL